MELLTTALGLIVVNLVLSGDNAVVIGMAAHRLESRQRMIAIVFGGIAAVVLRVIFTLAAAYLMKIPAIQFVGGVLLIWIAFKLLGEEADAAEHKAAASMWEAIWIITVADVVMSLDNVLAVAGVSRGDVGALVAGLAMSMPLVLFAGGIIASLINKFPWINLVGAVAIAYVAGEMMLGDQLMAQYGGTVVKTLEEAHLELALVPVLVAVAVPIVSAWMNSRSKAKEEAPMAMAAAGGEHKH